MDFDWHEASMLGTQELVSQAVTTCSGSLLRLSPSIEGRGRGIVARQPIPQGTVVLQEEPFVWHNYVQAKGDDRTMLQLLQRHPSLSFVEVMARYMCLEPNTSGPSLRKDLLRVICPAVHRNAFQVLRPFQLHVLAAAMANHSCVPNVKVEARWGDRRIPLLWLTSLTDIAANQEVFVAYTDVDEGVDVIDRNMRLQDGYGFECQCERCSYERDREISYSDED